MTAIANGNLSKTTAEKQEEAIERLLLASAEVKRGAEAVSTTLRDHKESYYVKPEVASYADASQVYAAAAHEEKQVVQVTRNFEYRPWDGAYATAKTLFELYGYTGFGKAMQSMFGSQPPQKISVKVSPTETVEVPWGALSVPKPLKGTLYLGSYRDNEKGLLYTITAEVPKKKEALVIGLFNEIEKTLREHSIYKGKAITAAEDPDFIDVYAVDPKQVVFKADVQNALEMLLWVPLEERELFQKIGQPKNWKALFDGSFGTGKTLASTLTAQRAVSAGITTIQVRPGVDDLKQAMQTAQLYAPALILFEDIDIVADPEKTSPEKISALLESFDGLRSKTASVDVVMTSNNKEDIHAGMVRAGRLNLLVSFGNLDKKALARLISVKIGTANLIGEVPPVDALVQYFDEVDMNAPFDLDAVVEACSEYEPAFMDLVINTAKRFALSRRILWLRENKPDATDEEKLDFKIGSADLVNAAIHLRPQHDLMMGAKRQAPNVSLELLIQKATAQAIQQHQWYDNDNDLYVPNLIED